MTTAYFDANAFVKLVVEEEGSLIAEQLWDASTEVISSLLTYPEVRAALAAAHRAGRLDLAQLDTAEDDFEVFWAGVRPLELTEALARIAGHECRNHALAGADGVHLASALAAIEADPIVVSWDKRLSAGALAAGLQVAP